MKEMKRRAVNTALEQAGCWVKSDDGDHTKWSCPCGKHSANIPRHRNISPGVLASTVKRLQCLPKGWLS